MKKILKKIAHYIDALTAFVGKTIAWLTVLLVLVVCYDVFCRYVLKQTNLAVAEFEWHLFAVIIMFAAAWSLKEEKHVRIDLFYVRYSAKMKALVNFLGALLLLLPFGILLTKTSIDFVSFSYKLKETSSNPGGLPMRYLIKATIPIGMFLLTLQGISLMIHSALDFSQEKHISEKDEVS